MRSNIGGKGQFGFHIEIVECFPDSENLPSRLSIKKVCLSFSLFFLDPFHRRGRVFDRKFSLSIYLFIHLSIITFSFIENSIIWCFRSCKPYIFWKHITLATSTALFWPSTTKYQPVPQYTDPVPPSNNRDK